MRQAKGNQLTSNTKSKWGFLRETKEKAQKAGIDADTGMHRNGLDEYLAVIFPGVSDWIHDKGFASKRPDFRSPSLRLIVEFDGKHRLGIDAVVVFNPLESLACGVGIFLYDQFVGVSPEVAVIWNQFIAGVVHTVVDIGDNVLLGQRRAVVQVN